MTKRALGLFDSREEAQRVQQDLLRAGFRPGEIRLAGVEQREERGFWDGLREFFGIQATDLYEEAARRGGTLLTVDAEERLDEAVDIIHRHHPVDITRRVAEWQRAGWRAPPAREADVRVQRQAQEAAIPRSVAPAASRDVREQPREPARRAAEPAVARRPGEKEEQAIPVVEEHLSVGKRSLERGGVRVSCRVVEEPVEQDVQLREEHVHVERRRVDRPAGPEAFREQIIEATETIEEPVISKEVRVVEEVVIGKDIEQRTQKVRDKLRHTDVKVESMEDVDYRDDYERNFASSGMAFDKIRPAYAYGRELAQEDRFRGRDFGAMENEARTGFEQRKLGQWDKLRGAVRHGFDWGRGAPRR